MIERHIYRAFTKGKTEIIKAKISPLIPQWKRLVAEQRLMTLSIFLWDQNLFLYYETIAETISPDEIMQGIESCVLSYPPGTSGHWAKMMDIFHYNKPLSSDHWRRNSQTAQATARINRLKPSMYSSYIYHHYQLQEEHPGSGDKYGIIGVHDDLMFFYTEMPTQVEATLQPGLLSTRNSPRDNWGELMNQHFAPWPHTDEKWLPIELLVQIPCIPR